MRSATSRAQILVERTFTATPERIYAAFTDPEQLTQWWWPTGFTCPSAEVDLRVGGAYRLTMTWPDFIPAEVRFSHSMCGEYYVLDHPHRLVMSGRAVNDAGAELFATLIDVTLDADGAGTVLTMRQSYFDPLPPPDALAGARQGWSEQLDKLTRLIEHRSH